MNDEEEQEEEDGGKPSEKKIHRERERSRQRNSRRGEPVRRLDVVSYSRNVRYSLGQNTARAIEERAIRVMTIPASYVDFHCRLFSLYFRAIRRNYMGTVSR